MRQSSSSSLEQHLPPGIGVPEFVAMMAAMMSMVALQIDLMLPALPEIGRDLHVPHANDRQLIIVMFFAGLGCGALIFGPLSDRFGRRPVLLFAGVGMLATAIMCAVAPSFEIMVAGRLLGGFFAASGRVMIASIARDCFQGDKMARIMSLVILIFIIVPIMAPTIGQAILYVAPWRAIFWLLVVLIALELLWVALRLPETLEPERRTTIYPRDLARSFAEIVTHRNSIGHMIASGLMLAGMLGFLSSVQQIFFDSFGKRDLLAPGFAIIAGGMALGSLLNGRLVERYGARRLSQAAVLGVIAVSLTHLALIVADVETVYTFILSQALVMTCFSFGGANFSAISLEPFSRSAGIASSIQTTLTTLISVVLGGLVGSLFDGTTLPMTLGFILFGCLSFFTIFWAEDWQLFRRPGHARLRNSF